MSAVRESKELFTTLCNSVSIDSHELRNVTDDPLFDEKFDEIGLIDLLLLVRTARQDLALVERALEDSASDRMVSDRVAVEGRWVAERRRGRDRSAWKNEDLTHEVVKRAIIEASVDRETGEIIEPNATTWAVRDALVATARPSWRVTALRELDIDPDEFCTSVKGRSTLQIITAEGARS